METSAFDLFFGNCEIYFFSVYVLGAEKPGVTPLILQFSLLWHASSLMLFRYMCRIHGPSLLVTSARIRAPQVSWVSHLSINPQLICWQPVPSAKRLISLTILPYHGCRTTMSKLVIPACSRSAGGWEISVGKPT